MPTAERPLGSVAKESEKLTAAQKETLEKLTKRIIKKYKRIQDLQDYEFMQELIAEAQELQGINSPEKVNQKYEIAEDRDHYLKWLIDYDKSMLDNPREGMLEMMTEEELINLPDEEFNDLFVFKYVNDHLNTPEEKPQLPDTADASLGHNEGRDKKMDSYEDPELAWLNEPVTLYDCERDKLANNLVPALKISNDSKD